MHIHRIVNQLDEYTLEAASIYTLCNLFHAGAKSTIVRAATFLDDSLANTIEYHYSVSSSRKKAFGEITLKVEVLNQTEGEIPKQTQLGKLSCKSKAKRIKAVSKETDFQRTERSDGSEQAIT